MPMFGSPACESRHAAPAGRPAEVPCRARQRATRVKARETPRAHRQNGALDRVPHGPSLRTGRSKAFDTTGQRTGRPRPRPEHERPPIPTDQQELPARDLLVADRSLGTILGKAGQRVPLGSVRGQPPAQLVRNPVQRRTCDSPAEQAASPPDPCPPSTGWSCPRPRSTASARPGPSRTPHDGPPSTPRPQLAGSVIPTVRYSRTPTVAAPAPSVVGQPSCSVP